MLTSAMVGAVDTLQCFEFKCDTVRLGNAMGVLTSAMVGAEMKSSVLQYNFCNAIKVWWVDQCSGGGQ